ncbi:hypothetical protein F9B85_12115 [Heliorestis acidaminivorans]|uniref:DUF2007 domain-containing protein n=1 Tax=Heliorestis acidaminivorans TaxID=553427 RepID=A0A6I0F338_9FIRM|nr:hypothetical protein [Heliorestis acidaminivorans]KAB2951544.1 hypothetical protein F9B85_12115 [Heliorestis acidaminivorans]
MVMNIQWFNDEDEWTFLMNAKLYEADMVEAILVNAEIPVRRIYKDHFMKVITGGTLRGVDLHVPLSDLYRAKLLLHEDSVIREEEEERG